MERKKIITKKQHYVPQFYLRQWCDKDNGFYPIKIENKIPPRLNIFHNKSNPSRFCYENFFYAKYTGKEDEISQIIEKSFAEAEAIFSKELPKLEKKILNYEQITDSDKWHLSECALFLHFRGKKYKNESQKIYDNFFKTIAELTFPNFIDNNTEAKKHMNDLGLTKEQMIDYLNKKEYSVKPNDIHHLRIIKDMVGFCNLLTAKYWMVYISRYGQFITTDAPYSDNALSENMWGNDFLSREQSFILSPRVMIVARYPDNKIGKKIKRNDITNDIGKIQTINSHNLDNCISFGFHKDKNILIGLEKTINFIYLHNRKK